jgi:phosphoglycerate kinase
MAVLMAGGKPDTKTEYVEAFAKRGCQVFTAPLLDGVYQQNVLMGVHVPVDYLVSSEGFVATFMAVVPVANVCATTILSIGPLTAQHYLACMSRYKFILINGIAGDYMQPAMTLVYQELLRQLIAQPHTAVIAGGGDTAAALQLWGLADKLNYLSTGGGAFLAYLSTGTLPFLKWI